MWVRFIVIPVVGGLIGWITNNIAIKLLFRPYQPIKIPLINYELQGLIPKRRDEIIETIANTVERELLSAEDILSYIKNRETMAEFSGVIIQSIEQRLERKIPMFIPMGFREIILEMIRDYLQREVPLAVEETIDGLGYSFRTKVRPAHIVKEKLNTFSLEQLEKLVFDVARRELKHIEYLGAVLGFVIGLGQAILVWYV